MQATNYVIYANPTSLTFSLKAGAGQATQSVKVNDTTPGPLPFTLSVDQPWVTISTTSSTTAGGGVVLQFGVNPAGMQAGSYTGHVILTASGVANSPMAFPVTLAIASTSTSSKSAVAPTISSQPTSAKIGAGQTASFSVAATGTAPMTYQWSKNGAAIGGATSSTYTTPAETSADNNATFTVAVSNAAGSATSNPATLTVAASTLLLNSSASSLNFGNVTLPNSSAQSVTLTNAGNSSITISNVTVSGAGFNATGVSGIILTPGQTATLTATFAPAAAGSATGKIIVASNATNSPGTISLSGTGVTTVSHSVALTWVPSTSAVIGYNAYSSTQSGGPYTKLTGAPVAATSYTDTAVQAGQTYFFVVTSVDSSNVESANSAEVSALVP